MKIERLIVTIVLLVLCPLSITAKLSRQDSILLARIFSFQRNYTQEMSGFATNVYIKHLYQTHRRNPTMWVIPSTYAIARGERTFISEQYSRLYFRSISDFDHLKQVYYTTIPRNRRTLPVLLEFITPNIYNVTMYGDHILSPFCGENHVYYTYSIANLGHDKMRLYFRPRFVPNTQLVKGKAIVDWKTGQVEQLEIEGEFDMIHFRTISMQGDYGSRALLPKLCKTVIEFKFARNHITSDFTAFYDCPITLPDTINVKGDKHLIDSVRPVSLSEAELAVYHAYDSAHAKRPVADTTRTIHENIPLPHPMAAMAGKNDSTGHKEGPRHDYLKEIGWDIIGSNLINSISTSGENGYLKLYPILNPQYLSYSSRKGLSYKMRMRGEYRFSDAFQLHFNPQVGYRFKRHELYYNIPVWFYCGRKKQSTFFLNTSLENRTGNAKVLEDIKRIVGEEAGLSIEERELHFFGDNVLQFSNKTTYSKTLTVTIGLTFHRRKALHPKELKAMGLSSKHHSMAPALSVSFRPWAKAPMFTIDYERAFKSSYFDVDYERWEADASLKHRLRRLQTLNLRVGGGIYTRRKGNYFMDFANFRDNNLPEGWDDDWSGDFQLLRSHLYNESQYYVRGNVSYESPLLGVSLIPLVGRYVERERVYWNGLGIGHTRMYSEIGYGFTTRFFSVGVFASFLNIEYQQMTAKFTFELFKRW